MFPNVTFSWSSPTSTGFDKYILIKTSENIWTLSHRQDREI